MSMPTTFLPEDYLVQKAERRTNIISLTLFAVVMIAVVGAFLVTNRQGRLIKSQQETINAQYKQAGLQIQELTQLETQKQEMLSKAELAAALVERVPRSILLAELINRMPPRLALLEFELKSEKVKPPAPVKEKDAKGRLAASAQKNKKKDEPADAPRKADPPRYNVTITMMGVAPTDLEVSRYMAELNAYSLLRDITLEYSEQKEIEGRIMRQFKIKMALDSSADVRTIDPLIVPRRIKNPMTDELQFHTSPLNNQAAAQPQDQEGR